MGPLRRIWSRDQFEREKERILAYVKILEKNSEDLPSARQKQFVNLVPHNQSKWKRQLSQIVKGNKGERTSSGCGGF